MFGVPGSGLSHITDTARVTETQSHQSALRPVPVKVGGEKNSEYFEIKRKGECF